MFHYERLSPVRILIASGTMILITACSSNPTPAKNDASQSAATKVAAAPATTPAPAESAAPTQPAPDTINGEPLSPDRILALQKAGYTFVDKDGQTYACRKEAKTGSRLARETVCMTPAQADKLREETQRRLGDMMRSVPPPQGT